MTVKIYMEDTTASCSSQVKHPVIPGSLKIIIKFLNFCGTCPLSWSKNEHQFQLFSYSTIICFTTSSLIIFAFGSFYVSVITGEAAIPSFIQKTKGISEGNCTENTIDESTVPLVRYLEVLFVLLIPASQIQAVIYGWFTMRPQASFLNSWRKFHLKFDKGFNIYLQQHQILPKSGKLQRFSFKFIAAFVIPVVAYAVIAAITRSAGTFTAHAALLTLVMSIGLLGAEYLEAAKTICMFRSIVNAYNVMKKGIEFTVLTQTCRAETVMRWRELAMMIRKQCSNMSKFLSQREILLVFQCILLSTSCIFCMGNLPVNKGTTTTTYLFWLYICSSTFLRIYVKALQAERITAAEQDLATAIALIKWKHTDISMQHEIKFLYDLVSTDPIRVKFGNYLTFNQRVVLTIVGQVVTYIIVLMQFAQK